MKKLVGIFLVATAIASPAFTQSVDPEMGTGNGVSPVPVFIVDTRIVYRHAGEDTYALSAHDDTDAGLTGAGDTGGGSKGYNENLTNW
jgi:hypothetical protein